MSLDAGLRMDGLRALLETQIFQEILKVQNQHKVEFCACLEVEHLYQSVGCAKTVSHCSTEPEIISLDAGLRMDGLLALDLLDLVMEVLRTTQGVPKPSQASFWKPVASSKSTTKINHVLTRNVDLSNVDQVRANVHLSGKWSRLYIFEDNEAVIKMIIKGRSPTMRHVSRTHSVALDWLFDGINLDPKIQIKCVDTKNQLADMLTKGNFTHDEWNNLLHLFNIMSNTTITRSHFFQKESKL